MNLLEKFIDNISSFNLVKSGDTIVIGVSGGADSMVLLHCFNVVKEKYDLTIKVAHINHKIRVNDAENDAFFVESYCKNNNIQFFLKESNVSILAKEQKKSEEEVGRNIRYSFFREIANKNGKIATAHNLNDNVETLLINLMRGCTIEGLSGIDFSRENIIRPLLNISRDEIEEFIISENIEHITDKTNFEEIYHRNKVRLNLIPYMEKLNPNIINTIGNNISSYSEDALFLKKYSQDIYSNIKQKTELGIGFNLSQLNEYDNAILKRIFTFVLKDITQKEQDVFSSKNINNILLLMKNKSPGKRLSLKNNIKVLYRNDNILEFYENKILSNEEHPLKINDCILFDDFIILTELSNIAINNNNTVSIPYYYFSSNNIKLRYRQNGDKISRNKKLKDFFISKKINNNMRGYIPLLCNDNMVLFIPSYFNSFKDMSYDSYVKVTIKKKTP